MKDKTAVNTVGSYYQKNIKLSHRVVVVRFFLPYITH